MLARRGTAPARNGAGRAEAWVVRTVQAIRIVDLCVICMAVFAVTCAGRVCMDPWILSRMKAYNVCSTVLLLVTCHLPTGSVSRSGGGERGCFGIQSKISRTSATPGIAGAMEARRGQRSIHARTPMYVVDDDHSSGGELIHVLHPADYFPGRRIPWRHAADREGPCSSVVCIFSLKFQPQAVPSVVADRSVCRGPGPPDVR
jgi:hypothetical protein